MTYVVTGALTLTILVVVALVSLRAISDGLPTARKQVYFAEVPDAGSLRTHDEVRIAGRREGQVGKVTTDGDRAVVELKLDPDITTLPSDTTVAIRPRGLLGVRYVELVTGRSARTISPGALIRTDRDNLAYGVPEVLDTFDPKTRRAVRGGVGGLGGGLSGRGDDLNRTLETLPGGARQLRSLSAAILARPGAARRLFPALDGATAAFDAARRELVDALRPTDSAVRPLIDRRPAFEETIDASPPTLRTAQVGLASGRRLLTAARSLGVAASDGLRPAPEGLRAATTLLRTSHEPLRRTAHLLPRLEAAVPATLDIAAQLDPVLDPLESGAEHLKRPVVTLGRYGCDMESMLANWRSTSGQATAGGNASGIGPLTTFRLNVIAGLGSVTPLLGRPGDGAAYVDRKTYSDPCEHAPTGYDALGLDGTPKREEAR